ncbi:DUF1559 domain-containing protein [Bremerella cremea]|nr:DUF1559 domain-containing protein [Bremerella cremea]
MEVLERYAGETGPCAVCAKTITIPPRVVESASYGTAQAPASQKDKDTSGVPLGTLIGLLGGAVVCFSVIFLVAIAIVRVALPAAHQMRVARMHNNSQENIRRIVRALNQYHDTHGSYPPAYFTDEKGKPSHSWRVMILPELGRNDLYNRYSFQEPWDAPINLQVIQEMPDVYTSYGAGATLGSGTTHMAAVVGKATMFPYAKSVKRSDISDPHDTVLAIVEVQGVGFDWTDPREDYDIDRPQGTFVIDDDTTGGKLLNSSTLTGNVGMLNEDTYHLSNNTSSATLRDMATRAGFEVIPATDFKNLDP